MAHDSHPSGRSSPPELRVLETLSLVVLVLLMGVATVWGALSSNARAGEFVRAQNEQRDRIAMELGVSTSLIETGHDVYMTTCISCHGERGEALPGLGKDIAHSDFVRGKTDTEMLMFLKTGRGSWDPLNTTGVDMPPKGGNPTLTDEQLQQIVVYLRYLNAAASS